MTHRAAGSLRGVPRIWLLPIALLTTILGLTAVEVFSRSLILDLAAWWPAWLVLVLAGALAHRRRIGRLRVDGLVPILVTLVVVVFVAAHVNGWPLNPSASGYLVGPEADDYSVAEMTASVDGELVVTGGSSFLYEVDPLPGGGGVGVPVAEERMIADAVSVILVAPADPGYMAFSGWKIALSEASTWNLDLTGELDLDLSGVRVGELELSGTGKVALGFSEVRSHVTIDGAFEIGVPVGVPVRVVGGAQVPGAWEQTTDGWASPVGGIGWVIEVPEDSVISILER